MKLRTKVCARRATWLAFGLVALAAVSSSAQEAPPQFAVSKIPEVSFCLIIWNSGSYEPSDARRRHNTKPTTCVVCRVGSGK